ELDRPDTGRAYTRKFLELGFLHGAVRRRHEDVTRLLEIAHWKQRIDALALFERQQVDDRFAARAAARLRNLVHLTPVHLAAAGETEYRRVRVGDDQLLDEILFLYARRALAASAAPLRAVRREGLGFDLTGGSQRDHDGCGRNQILDTQADARLDYLGTALVAVLILQ